MFWFKKMLDVAKTHGVMDVTDETKASALVGLHMSKMPHKFNKKSARDTFFEYAKESKIFIFKEVSHNEVFVTAEEQLHKLPDSIPFPCIFIEQIEREGSIGTAFQRGPSGPEYPINLKGLLVKEIAPYDYDFFFLMEVNKNEYAVIRAKSRDKEDKDFSGMAANTLDFALKGLRRDDVGIASVNEKVKIKTEASGSEFFKIKKIIYVVPKKEREIFVPREAKEIDWSHRWLVRGHWRRTDSIGKDRDGNYCVRGFTWVTEHEKGPEEAPLVADKVRVVK